jgi:hypothetical protein
LSGRVAPASKPLAEALANLPSQLCALVDSCLADSPDARPGAEQIVATLERT